MTFVEFRDVLTTAAAFRAWDLGKGDLPTISDGNGGANPNADLQAMADALPDRAKPAAKPAPPPTAFK